MLELLRIALFVIWTTDSFFYLWNEVILYQSTCRVCLIWQKLETLLNKLFMSSLETHFEVN